MRTVAGLVVLLGAIKVHEHRQRPRPGGKGDTDQHGQDHPFVAITPGGVVMAGADGIAMTSLAVDLATGMAINGVIADQSDAAGGDKALEYESTQGTGQLKAGPVRC